MRGKLHENRGFYDVLRKIGWKSYFFPGMDRILQFFIENEDTLWLNLANIMMFTCKQCRFKNFTPHKMLALTANMWGNQQESNLQELETSSETSDFHMEATHRFCNCRNCCCSNGPIDSDHRYLCKVGKNGLIWSNSLSCFRIPISRIDGRHWI